MSEAAVRVIHLGKRDKSQPLLEYGRRQIVNQIFLKLGINTAFVTELKTVRKHLTKREMKKRNTTSRFIEVEERVKRLELNDNVYNGEAFVLNPDGALQINNFEKLKELSNTSGREIDIVEASSFLNIKLARKKLSRAEKRQKEKERKARRRKRMQN